MKPCPVCNSQIPDNQEVPELVPLGYHEDTLALSIKRRIAAEEKLRWIPASERLPENVVLLRMLNSHYPIIGRYSATTGCIASITGGQYPLSLLTHWMPLPEPPQEVE